MVEENQENKKIKIKRHLAVLPKNEYVAVRQILLTEPGYQIQWSDQSSEYFFFYRELGREHLEWIWPFVNQYYGEYVQDNHLDFNQVKLDRIYVNCQPSHHPGDWHEDGGPGFTLLYYPDLDIDYGDEAGLEIKGHGIEPYIPNSVLIIPGDVTHRANMHTQIGKFRFSIAVKFRIILPIPDTAE
jgi:hypothetical protein